MYSFGFRLVTVYRHYYFTAHMKTQVNVSPYMSLSTYVPLGKLISRATS